MGAAGADVFRCAGLDCPREGDALKRALVAVMKTAPRTVFDDLSALVRTAGLDEALKPGVTTILKDNISWHLPFLSANTTPWQLEGTIKALRANGFSDLVAVHNDTVVTDAFRGLRLNKLEPVYRRYGIPERFNFLPDQVSWEPFHPRARMRVLDRLFPKGIMVPTLFRGRNIVHLPTAKCHIYTTVTGAMKNAFGGLLTRRRHYTHSAIHETLVDLLAVQKDSIQASLRSWTQPSAATGPVPAPWSPWKKASSSRAPIRLPSMRWPPISWGSTPWA